MNHGWKIAIGAAILLLWSFAGGAARAADEVSDTFSCLVAETIAQLATGDDGCLPAGIVVDRVTRAGRTLSVDLTLPIGLAPNGLGVVAVEEVYLAVQQAVLSEADINAIVLRARISGGGGYRPLTDFTPHAEPAIEVPVFEVGPAPPVRFPPPPPAVARGVPGRQPVGALTGVTVFCNGGHGWTSAATTWGTQRPLLLNMVEDYGNLEQLNAFVQHAFRAGATVVPFRPTGNQTVEIVLDNDDPGVVFSGTWQDSLASVEYYENGATSSGVPYRWALAETTETATARYTPTIPTSGFYPVYCWARDGNDRTLQTYRIQHSGGIAEVSVDHRLVGKGWVWLGDYHLEAGTGSYVEITNESTDPEVVIADAIRWGCGMGDVVGAGPGTVSGYPRDEECARYWAESETAINAVGMPASIYDCCSTDQNDNVGTAARWARQMNRTTVNGDRWRRVYLEFHSNASGGTSRGSVALISSSSPTTYQSQYAAIIGQNLEDDMSALNSFWEHPWGDYFSPTLSGGFGAIATYNNSDEFDATILEVAFHDNASDAQLLLDAKVRDAVARSSVQSIIEFLNSLPGSTVPLAFPPETPVEFSVVVEADGSGVRLSWVAGPSGGSYGDPPGSYVVYRSGNGYGYDGGVDVGNVLSTVIGNVPVGEVTYFRLAATNGGGESMPSPVLAVRLPSSGRASVLVVNGYDRLERVQDPVQNIPAGPMQRPLPRRINSFDYVIQYAGALHTTDIAFDSCANEAVINGAVSLLDYAAVVWICGEESDADRTFDATEQALVTSYLAGGGALFVTGAEIGWDLDFLDNGRTFYQDDLGADYAGDDAETYQAVGAVGSILEDISAFTFDPADGAPYDAEYPDRVAPFIDAINCLNYVGGNGGGAGLQYDAGTYRVVVFGFPYELITSTAIREAIMSRVMAFLIDVCSLVTFGDFEGYGDGTQVMFRNPGFSGTTAMHLDPAIDLAEVSSEVPAPAGDKLYKVAWQWHDFTPQRWVRLTTFDTVNKPNPVVDLTRPLRLRLRLDSGAFRLCVGIRETGIELPIGENGGTSGDIEWLGATSVTDGAPQGVLVTADPGVWQTLVLDPERDPVIGFTGNGSLSAPNDKGVLEHIALAVVADAGPFVLYLDQVEQLCDLQDPDVDGDGDVDGDDVVAFVAVLLGSPIDPDDVPRADMNGDDRADGRDIQLFVDAFVTP